MPVDLGSDFARLDILQHAAVPVSTQPLRAEYTSRIRILPPPALPTASATSLPVKLAQTCLNKSKRAVFCVAYTPDGRRILSGTMNGEFALWHATSFGLEMVMQAHESGVRCARYSHDGEWLVSGDQQGMLKVWQPNFNNVKMQTAHAEVLRDLAWSPNDAKLATCSDDGSVKIWNFATMTMETSFAGPQAHGWDVKCVDWHPTYALLASGSKDNTLRLWDPRQAQPVLTIHDFKNTVSSARFQPAGNMWLLAAGSRDHTTHVYDLRQIKAGESFRVLRGHDSDVSCVAWHPTHADLLTTATHDGGVHHFLLNCANLRTPTNHWLPAYSIPHAHQWPVWDLAYHPAGHALATGANDKTVRIWTRAAPGDSRETLQPAELFANEALEIKSYVKPKRAGIPGLS